MGRGGMELGIGDKGFQKCTPLPEPKFRVRVSRVAVRVQSASAGPRCGNINKQKAVRGKSGYNLGPTEKVDKTERGCQCPGSQFLLCFWLFFRPPPTLALRARK